MNTATVLADGSRRLHGLVGVLWRIRDPESVRVGDCFMEGRLKKDDLWLGKEHSGDCFQYYMFVEEYSNCLIGIPGQTFGSYGIGDSERVELASWDVEKLKCGERLEITLAKNHPAG